MEKSKNGRVKIQMVSMGSGDTGRANESGTSPTCLHQCFNCWDIAAKRFYWIGLCGTGSNLIKQSMQIRCNLHYLLCFSAQLVVGN